MNDFSRRSRQKELMDDLNCSGIELAQTLRELKTINRWLGGNKVTTDGLAKLFKQYPQSAYQVADIGCGGGDMIQVMHDWAKKNQINIDFSGIDANRNIIEMASVRLNEKTPVRWLVQNVFSEEFLTEKVDVLTCTLFTHHFTDGELVDLLTAFRQKARLGIVINDLHRHPLAYQSIKWLTRLFSHSKMVQHDAPVSVLRSFSKQDWERILTQASIDSYSIRWFWAFRWQLVITF
ncbi:methyltransferase domain-containing protein [Algoriphagus hitonicola]|uniref:Methyltransferase domain-containing protein n=1 Tax=Algoriphagus hitonicola TaxID=435880 RepID=A0A1I2S0A4_9BACT|nr:methyltransferase domain-containing protein [Algoriphagus hitonicola]SFG46365.1 Methyltransferase domain-containing protein [Algoriphagus hitonicola]